MRHQSFTGDNSLTPHGSRSNLTSSNRLDSLLRTVVDAKCKTCRTRQGCFQFSTSAQKMQREIYLSRIVLSILLYCIASLFCKFPKWRSQLNCAVGENIYTFTAPIGQCRRCLPKLHSGYRATWMFTRKFLVEIFSRHFSTVYNSINIIFVPNHTPEFYCVKRVYHIILAVTTILRYFLSVATALAPRRKRALRISCVL